MQISPKFVARGNLFIFVFDVSDPEIPQGDVHERIISSQLIESWWNYLPGVYIIETDADPAELRDALFAAIGRGTCIIHPFDLQQMNGRMPVAGWSWMLGLEGDARDRFESAAEKQYGKK